MNPQLTTLAIVSLTVAVACAVVITMDLLAGNKQKMWIMNIVWPVTALYSGPLGLWAYYKIGRSNAARQSQKDDSKGGGDPSKEKPFPQITAVAATHCGAGCTLGDLIAEWFVFFVPLYLWGHKIFGTWALDFAFAYVIGIGFQYFTIAPMRHLDFSRGLWAAVKADTLSLAAWQLGMYGWMGFVHFVWLGEIPKTNPVLWFMMQIAMLAGFLTSYPVNWWLVKAGWKEKM